MTIRDRALAAWAQENTRREKELVVYESQWRKCLEQRLTNAIGMWLGVHDAPVSIVPARRDLSNTICSYVVDEVGMAKATVEAFDFTACNRNFLHIYDVSTAHWVHLEGLADLGEVIERMEAKK